MDQLSFEPIEAEAPAAVIAVDRAIGDLRRGGVVVLADAAGGASLVLSCEYAGARRLARFDALARAPAALVLTARRAAALGITAGAGAVVALALAAPADAALVHDLSDPAAARAAGTALPAPAAASARDGAAVELAKLASLLPAVVTKSLDRTAAANLGAWAAARGLLVVQAADIDRHRRLAPAALERISAARVPLADAEDTTIVAFRPVDGGAEHLAMVIGSPDPRAAVLARIHSQCFTGDLLASLRCDCGDQLRGAIRAIAEAGGGVVLYLAQEGRGIGLVNKLRAYQLQDQGRDTFQANEELGFDADERHWRVAAEMLRQLGFARVRLLTNNPEKIAGLRRAGIEVAERVAHAVPANPHNRRYLAAKAARGGHLL